MMIKIGLIGAAWITPMAIIEPALLMDGVEVCAVAARDLNRANEYAQRHNIPHVENCYEDLLARKDIDLIYIALPVSFHEEWATKALQSGKHVLCEKPLSMNAEQAKRLAKVSQNQNRYLIEAFHYRHHPHFNRILEIINSGELGKISKITGHLSVPVPSREGQIRHNKALGGGALMDLGCYPIHMIRTIAGQEPRITKVEADIGPTGVDLTINAQMVFPNGIKGVVRCAMPETGELEGGLIVEGSAGKLVAGKPILPHLGGTLTIDGDKDVRVEKTNMRTTFSYQLQAVLDAVRGASQPMPSLVDSIANATAMDAIKRIGNL